MKDLRYIMVEAHKLASKVVFKFVNYKNAFAWSLRRIWADIKMHEAFVNLEWKLVRFSCSAVLFHSNKAHRDLWIAKSQLINYNENKINDVSMIVVKNYYGAF